MFATCLLSYDEVVNEISLLFYGQPEKLNSALLLNLNIIEFRNETLDRSGLYVLENKFGKEVERKLSLEFNTDDSDWLVYRYLSDEDLLRLRSNGTGRKVYVLLQNYMTMDYFKTHVPADSSSLQYIVGQNELVKSMTSVAGQISDKNVMFVRNVKASSKPDSFETNRKIPDFLAILLKLILNPVDELNIISKNLMHSNRRVLYRLIELLNFIHVILYRGIGLQLFWKSIATFGFFKVASIKTKFFLRHLLLMEFYKAWGFTVDGFNFLIRVKDKFILTVYYRTIHRFFYNFIHRFFYRVLHRAIHNFWLSVISPLYFKVLRPAFLGAYGFAEKWIYYNGVHKFAFLCFKFAGYIWQRFLSPLYFATVHRFFYGVLVKVLYYGVIHRMIHKILKPFLNFIYYGIVHSAVHSVLKPVVSFIYYDVLQAVFYSVFHRGYHQIIKPAVSFVFYRGLHLIYHQGIKPAFSYVWFDFIVAKVFYGVILKGYYDVILRGYYSLKVALLYRLWPWVKFNFFIRTHHFFVFKIRHYFLMAVFKSYGLGYDIVMLALRVTKLYLLYPVFKIYWFTSFQYKKRIKKYFA